MVAIDTYANLERSSKIRYTSLYIAIHRYTFFYFVGQFDDQPVDRSAIDRLLP